MKLCAKTLTLTIISAIITGTMYNYLQETIDMEFSRSQSINELEYLAKYYQ